MCIRDRFNSKYEEFLDGQRSYAKSILEKRQAELRELMEKNIAFKAEACLLYTSFNVNSSIGFCRDANNFYWLIRGGNVWKGRFNRDGWRKEDVYKRQEMPSYFSMRV